MPETGLSKTRLYSIFSGMKQRCYNPNSQAYEWYGAKGITICDEWMGEEGLSRFFEWALNNGYEEHLTIDRINAGGPYSPENCQWITQSENSARVEHPAKPKAFVRRPGMDYSRLQDILKTNDTTLYKLNAEKVIGSATRQKLLGQIPGGIDARTIETLCKRLNCQPGDFMTYVPEDHRE